MLSKKEVKDIQSLRHKKFRDEANFFVAEGPKIVSELLKTAPQNVIKIYALEEWMNSNHHLLLDAEHQTISSGDLEKISQLQTPNEVVAVLHQFNSVVPEDNGVSLYLDAIQDPGNLGTIIRIADWFGIANVVCSEGCADLYNSKVVQSTMASIARVNVHYDKDFSWLKLQTRAKLAAMVDGDLFYEASLPENGVVIIGNESKGIQPSILELDVQKISIPRRGQAESLNAAVASGIILSHWFRDH